MIDIENVIKYIKNNPQEYEETIENLASKAIALDMLAEEKKISESKYIDYIGKARYQLEIQNRIIKGVYTA